MKKYDVTLTIILTVEALDETDALDVAVVELEDNFGHLYIADSEIVEIK